MKNVWKFLIWLIFINDHVMSFNKFGKGNGFHETVTINDVLIQILQVCHANYKNILVYQIDGYDKIVSDVLWVPEHLSIIYFDEKSIRNKKAIFYDTKVDAILLISYSLDELKLFISTLGSVSWWEFDTSFYIVDRSNSYCSEVYDIFKRVFLTEVLKAYVICQNAMMNFMIYTNNPFTDYAPSLWTRYHRPGGDPSDKVDFWGPSFDIKTHEEPHDWVIYERTYDKDIICDEFDFDRTRFLNKYPILLGIQLFVSGSDVEISEKFPMFTYRDDNYREEQNLKETLNIVFDLQNMLVPRSSMATNFSELFDYFKSFHNSTFSADLIPTEVNYSDEWTYDNSFPIKWNRFGILSQHKGYKTPVEKIRDFYGIWILTSMTIMLLITFFVVWITKNRNTGFATFEILRLLINASIFTEINTPPRKIFFCMVFLYFLIIHATFSGHLAEFLTKPELQSHPETLEDLKNSMYQGIAVTGLGANILTDQALIDKMIVFADPMECVNAVLSNSSIVCIEKYNLLLQTTFSYNVHISKHPFGLRCTTYLIRRRWRLNHRINEFYSRLMENGIGEVIYKEEYQRYTIKTQMMNAEKQDYFRPIDFQTVNVGFLILGIGWISATIIFCIEQLMSKKKDS